ncbi:MAG: polymer-forming cytoskeletal protein [Nitrospinaceae bacterium]
MALKKDDVQLKAFMGEEAVFNGSLTFEGTVRIDGKFEGQVVTEDTLIVGETGQVIADITAGTVICMGKIEGTIVASKKVEVHATSQVVGTLRTPALYVEVGAILDGNCDMSGQGSKIVKLVKNEENEPGGVQGAGR